MMKAHLEKSAGALGSDIHFYSSSGGNAGLACVHAANALGYPSTVVVPTSTSAFMMAKIKSQGATEVIQKGENWMAADRYLREEIIAKNPSKIYCPPFDHADIWEGNSTIISELRKQLPHDVPSPDAIICSVGGGGLFCGIMKGLTKIRDHPGSTWTRTKVLAVETLGADSLSQALKANELITLPAITSAAKTLGASQVARQAFEYGKDAAVTSVVLSDAEAAMGCWRFADDERMMVELSCGVNLALCYDGRLVKYLGKPITPDMSVVIVVCGGQGVSVDMLSEWRKEYGFIEDQIHVNGDVPSSVTAPI